MIMMTTYKEYYFRLAIDQTSTYEAVETLWLSFT